MHRRSIFIVVCSAVLVIGVGPAAAADGIGPDSFRHRYIADDLPGDRAWGYGVSVMADFDRDGDMDYATAVRRDGLYWFENRGDGSAWARHPVGRLPMVQLGSAAMDADDDGWTDIVIGRYWYRNPRAPRERPFERREYDSTIRAEIHDIVTADVNGDGRADVVVLGDGDGCFWYDVPMDAAGRDADWPRTAITLDALNDRDDIHAGFFPRGVGDLDGDGDPDVVLPDRWLENRDQGRRWRRHELGWARGKRGPWGLSCRSWITDLDGDGDADIVIVDSDQARARAGWLRSDGGSPPRFTPHELPRTAPGQRGSFHSLAVADFDLDGDPDVFTVEQEDDSIPPEGAGPRWFIWENLGGSPPAFAERIILDAKLGGHDARVGDADGDGDADIASKVWKPWAGNANGGREHADLLENLSR